MEDRLLEMWRDEKHLYDSTSKGYRNSRLRQDSLMWFAADLDIRSMYKIISDKQLNNNNV